MPFKYNLYNIICYLLLAATAILFIDLVYELSKPHVTSPAWGMLIFLVFFACYFTFPVLGIGLIKTLHSNEDVTRSKLILIRVVFFVQIIFQGFLIYNSPEIVEEIIRYSKRSSFSFGFDQRGIMMEALFLFLGLMTLYLEIFTFPLVKLVKNNYLSILQQINNIGS